MDRNSNGYTFLFAGIMVTVVGALLAFTATSLKPAQDENVKKEKMQNILASVGVDVDRENAAAKFDGVITEKLSLSEDGSVKTEVNAFNVDLKEELAKPANEQTYPLYIAEQEGKKFYIIPLRGAGLWDAIWGYIALESDVNTVEGTVFDHKGETPGLGAEITQKWFQERFVGKEIRNESGKIVGIDVVKSSPSANQVDAISGATITSNGVAEMIAERLKHYQNYFDQLKK